MNNIKFSFEVNVRWVENESEAEELAWRASLRLLLVLLQEHENTKNQCNAGGFLSKTTQEGGERSGEKKIRS